MDFNLQFILIIKPYEKISHYFYCFAIGCRARANVPCHKALAYL